MSIEYVTLEEARDQVRAPGTIDDDRIELLIKAASGAVKNYLGSFSAYEAQRNDDDDYLLDSNFEPEIQLDNDGERVVKSEVKQAVLLLIERWYRGKVDGLPTGSLPPEVTALLYPLRDPACR